jgi:hypothetical protein
MEKRELTEQPKILYHLLQSFQPLLFNKVSEVVGLSECKCMFWRWCQLKEGNLVFIKRQKSDPTVRTCELLFRRDNAA